MKSSILKFNSVIIVMFLLLLNTTLFAQCYKSNIDVGKQNYSAGKYVTAKNYFTTSLKCPDAKDGAEAKQWIQKCNNKIVEQKRVAEERRIAEEKRIAEERRIAEEKRLEEERRIEEQNKLKIGQNYAGGIIFYIDNTGKHGKVCATEDQSPNAKWNEAKAICTNLTFNGYSDWYLPSKDELNVMYKKLHLKNMGVFATGYYWSSSESDANNAWLQCFFVSNQYDVNKSTTYYVRGVRSF